MVTPESIEETLVILPFRLEYDGNETDVFLATDKEIASVFPGLLNTHPVLSETSVLAYQLEVSQRSYWWAEDGDIMRIHRPSPQYAVGDSWRDEQSVVTHVGETDNEEKQYITYTYWRMRTIKALSLDLSHKDAAKTLVSLARDYDLVLDGGDMEVYEKQDASGNNMYDNFIKIKTIW